MPYDDRYRTRQRLQGSFLNPKASQSYSTLQDVGSKQVVYDLLFSNDFHNQFHRYASSILLALGYGKCLPRGDEPELAAVAQAMRNLVATGKVGAWICDAIPPLNYLPNCLAHGKWRLRNVPVRISGSQGELQAWHEHIHLELVQANF
jgi:hypothetical protein